MAGNEVVRAKRDLRQELTDKFVAALDAGKIPWERPWTAINHGSPRNAFSDRRYSGGNRLFLSLAMLDAEWGDPRFGTFNQIRQAGGMVKKGEHGIPIELWRERPFWERRDVTVLDGGSAVRIKGLGATRELVELAGGRTVAKARLRVEHGGNKLSWQAAELTLTQRVSQVHVVFNVAQADGLNLEPLPSVDHDTTAHERLATIQAAMARDGLQFGVDPKQAYYRPSEDKVYMPPVEAFHSQQGHAGTLLHEIGHATGAAQRLNREGIAFVDTTDREKYAREELRAEIFSAFMAAETGISWDRSQHEGYVQGWAEALKKDKNEIFRAAADAGAAVDYVIAKEQEVVREREAPDLERSMEEATERASVGDTPAEIAELAAQKQYEQHRHDFVAQFPAGERGAQDKFVSLAEQKFSAGVIRGFRGGLGVEVADRADDMATRYMYSEDSREWYATSVVPLAETVTYRMAGVAPPAHREFSHGPFDIREATVVEAIRAVTQPSMSRSGGLAEDEAAVAHSVREFVRHYNGKLENISLTPAIAEVMADAWKKVGWSDVSSAGQIESASIVFLALQQQGRGRSPEADVVRLAPAPEADPVVAPEPAKQAAMRDLPLHEQQQHPDWGAGSRETFRGKEILIVPGAMPGTLKAVGRTPEANEFLERRGGAWRGSREIPFDRNEFVAMREAINEAGLGFEIRHDLRRQDPELGALADQFAQQGLASERAHQDPAIAAPGTRMRRAMSPRRRGMDCGMDL